MRDPINPADIRVGDRVERVYVSGDHETIERFTVESVAHRAVSSCRWFWVVEAPRVGTAEWFLLDRPDPLAEVVGEAARALWRYYECELEADPEPDSEYSMAYRSAARTIVAAISERWELVEKSG